MSFLFPLQFWYRQSPRPLRTAYPFEVTSRDPMPFYSGEWKIGMDSAGRLNYFRRHRPTGEMPRQKNEVPSGLAAAVCRRRPRSPTESRCRGTVAAGCSLRQELCLGGERTWQDPAGAGSHLSQQNRILPRGGAVGTPGTGKPDPAKPGILASGPGSSSSCFSSFWRFVSCLRAGT